MMEGNGYVRRPRRVLALALIFLPSAALYVWAATPGVVGFYHDDGLYVVTAKALATGQGYRIISLPEAWPQTKYPIFYPFVLSLIWRLYPAFPSNLFAMKLVSVFSSLLFLYLTYRFLIRFRYASHRAAFGILALTAFSPWVVYFSSMVLSEMPYALLSIIALHLAESALSDERRPVQKSALAMAAGFVAGLAYLTRSIGVALLAAILLFLIYKKAWRLSLCFLVTSAPLVVPWNVWVYSQLRGATVGDSLQTYYMSYTGWFLEHMDGMLSLKTADVMCKNIISFIEKMPGLILFPLSFIPIPRKLWVPDGVGVALYTLLGFLLVLSIGILLKRNGYKARLLDSYLLVYLLLILIWPWPCIRFLVPVFPFLLLALYRAASGMGHKVTEGLDVRSGRVSAIWHVLILSSLLVNISVSLAAIEYSASYGQAFVPFSKVKLPDWKTYQSLFQWVRENVPDDAILAGGSDPLYYLYTGRRAISEFCPNPYDAFYVSKPSPITLESEQVENDLRQYKANYLIVIPGIEPTLDDIIRLINRRNAGFFKLAFESEERSISVYKIE